jgi:ABC-2 type transport system permease protein
MAMLTQAVGHSAYHTVRHIRGLLRQPVFVALTLIQPFIWLLLFGALFKRVIDIPGFQATSYVDYLVPGIVVMTGFFAGGWNGVAILNDMDRGTLDRFLVTPVRRVALIFGPLGYQAVATVIQSLIIIAVGYGLGARYPGGVVGIVVFLIATILLCSALAAMSNAIALMVRQEESLIGFVQFTALPLTFLSTALMPANLVPGWVETVAKFNPVNWAIEVGRTALTADPDWGLIGTRMLYLLGLTALLVWAALAAFRSYQRSV